MSVESHLPLLSSAMLSAEGPRSGPNSATPVPVDYDAVMQAHLARVFGERDESRRLLALKELYTEDATLFEPHAAVTGHRAISRAIDAVQASLPADFVFTPSGVAVGHSGFALLYWQAGPPGGPAVVTGTDVAKFEHGRIEALYVFVDQTPR